MVKSTTHKWIISIFRQLCSVVAAISFFFICTIDITTNTAKGQLVKMLMIFLISCSLLFLSQRPNKFAKWLFSSVFVITITVMRTIYILIEMLVKPTDVCVHDNLSSYSKLYAYGNKQYNKFFK